MTLSSLTWDRDPWPVASERGLLSELLLLKMHGRVEHYLAAGAELRAALTAVCRREATVPDLARRILCRTVYAQAASRVAALRELLQNALDASPRGGRIDVRLEEDGCRLSVRDRGRGMTGREVIHDLLVPFCSSKEDDEDSIGEHGIGFFASLEIAPRVEVTTSTGGCAWRLCIEPMPGNFHYRSRGSHPADLDAFLADTKRSSIFSYPPRRGPN